MGIERTTPAKHFRKRAAQMRAKADNATSLRAKQSLRQAARSYDRLADTAQQLQRGEEQRDQRAAELKPRRKSASRGIR